MKERILQDAEQTAERMLAQAREEAAQIRSEAEQETSRWWDERRADDEALRASASREGYDEGSRQGAEEAERRIRGQMDEALQEALSIVRQAYVERENLIAEAEHFVVELSSQIAGKIVGRKLEESPELAVSLMAEALSRRKEQGVITLCVAPSQFAFVQAAKEDLTLSIDSQAELHILPDPSVKDGGCVIRSAFGSIDARLDTQLTTIRQELLQIAAHAHEEGRSDDTEA
ncbi:FliH/SctL family protein [Cohnella nanjingensis]|uniref:FliH/SctL family protein n=1 Tax=Cohnella nanjingensis TaxID=1387779 RepID=UPI001FE9E19B|nr:FliH/SctL family protein [Cohnella nanjingensis]